MISFKPEIDSHSVQAVIENIVKDRISDLQPIDFGELSKVFSYTLQGKDYVIHFNSSDERHIKEKFLYKKFSRQGIKIPKIVHGGQVEELYFSISEKAHGQVIASLIESDVEQVLPDLAQNFITINQAQVDQSTGYGWIQPSGEGAYFHWSEFLESLFTEEQTGFWNNWYTLFDNSFLEKDVFDYVYKEAINLARYAPREKYLVHGDFHLGNMIADNGTVTGIVDWEMAMYGDFMFDFGTMHFWSPQLEFPQLVRKVWAQKGLDIPYFEERLLYGMLFKGIDGLRFYAKKGDEDAYESVKKKVLDLLK